MVLSHGSYDHEGEQPILHVYYVAIIYLTLGFVFFQPIVSAKYPFVFLASDEKREALLLR